MFEGYRLAASLSAAAELIILILQLPVAYHVLAPEPAKLKLGQVSLWRLT